MAENFNGFVPTLGKRTDCTDSAVYNRNLG